MPTTTQRTSLRSSLQFRLGNRTDLGNAKLDDWLDRGLTYLSTRVFIRDLEGIDTSKQFTVANNSLSFPTNMIAITDIRNTTTNLPLEFIEKSRFRQLRIGDGAPRLWTVIGTTIYFDKNPTANDSLSILGVSTHTWAAADGATPPCDPQHEFGLLLCAALIGLRDLGDSQRAALIEAPDGSGEFPMWVRMTKLPPLIQGMANRRQSGVSIDMASYEGIQ